MVRSAQIALRTYETDHDTFAATRADLERIEPSIGEAAGDFTVSGTATTFTISERSASGTLFTLQPRRGGPHDADLLDPRPRPLPVDGRRRRRPLVSGRPLIYPPRP